jgi:hypothetical protein
MAQSLGAIVRLMAGADMVRNGSGRALYVEMGGAAFRFLPATLESLAEVGQFATLVRHPIGAEAE